MLKVSSMSTFLLRNSFVIFVLDAWGTGPQGTLEAASTLEIFQLLFYKKALTKYVHEIHHSCPSGA